VTDDMLEAEKQKTETELVDRIRIAAHRLADAVSAEAALEDNRHTIKYAVTERIMLAGDNKFTGKPHSFSSAEAAATTDEEYINYLERLRSATRERILARGEYDAACAAARLREAIQRDRL
jgi:hypothetical protein